MSLPFTSLEVPIHIAVCLGGSFLSSITLALGFVKVWLGNIPNPQEAGAWSFYGVLIVAVIVLFSCMVVAVRWFVGYWLKVQQDINDRAITAMNATTAAIQANTNVTEKQNKWFEEFAQHNLKRLEFPPQPPR